MNTTIKTKTTKTCKNPDCGKTFELHKSTEKFCCWQCKVDVEGLPKFKKVIPSVVKVNTPTRRPLQRSLKPIPKFSKKRERVTREYLLMRSSFLSLPANRICKITGEPTTDLHHKMGRSQDAFADAWAEERGIVLTNDKRFWMAVSRKGHRYIHEHPELAIEKGYLISRNSIRNGTVEA